MWITLVSLAQARPDGLEVWRYLDWHCTNPPRMQTGVPLVDLPSGPTLDDGEAWQRRVGVPAIEGVLVVGAAENEPPIDYDVIVVEPNVAAAHVAVQLAELAKPLRSAEVRWLAFGRGGEVVPRPEPPVAVLERDRFFSIEAELRGSPERQEEVRAEAAGRCPTRMPVVGDTCAEASQALANLLRDRRCRADPTATLAWWSAVMAPGEGRPVWLIPVRATGQDQVPTAGVWADAGPIAARLADLSMSPIRYEDRTAYVPFRMNELTLQRRVLAHYPEDEHARALPEQRCTARIWIDWTGVPERVEVSGCEEAFIEPARSALMSWRWYPPRLGPVHVRAVTSVAITFRRER